jgi:glycosyltransferase involved in cell wall biosynthesis
MMSTAAPRPMLMFSPLPPRKSGIAAYTAELLPALCAHRPVTVVCEEGPTPEVMALLPPCGEALQVISMADYTATPELRSWPHVYQIGNNADHIFAYQASLRHPGVVVLHDFNLHYLVEDATLAKGDKAGYRQTLGREFGPVGRALADLRHAGIFSESQKLSLPVNQHVLRHARAVVVHNQWIHDRLPAAVRPRSHLIPHHYSPRVADVRCLTQDQARARLGLPPQGFMVLSLGFITPPKQVQATLHALARLRDQGEDFFFVVAGERSSGFDVDGLIGQLGLQERVIVTGYVSEADFFDYIMAADCLVNLRYPTVGESSGTLARALALGLPAIVHNFGPSSEYPDSVVFKVPLELGEPLALASALSMMMNNPSLRACHAAAAQSHMRQHGSIEGSALGYLRCVDTLAATA